MRTEILSLRISRRAIGAAILGIDGLIFTDGRHLPSTPSRALNAATRFLEQWLRPSTTAVIIDAPSRGVSATTDELLRAIAETLAVSKLPPVIIGKTELLAAYSVLPLRMRGEVRNLVSEYWPQLSSIKGRVRPWVVDAAAAALYGECRVTLSPQPT